MTIYVDDMRRPARPTGYRGRGTPRWSHLFADTPNQLRAIAAELGLNPTWLQHPGTHREHYDVTDTVRTKAVRLGAVTISYPWAVADLLGRRRDVCRCDTLASCQWSAMANQALAVGRAPAERTL